MKHTIIVFVFSLVIVPLTIFLASILTSIAAEGKHKIIDSPLPTFLNMAKNNQVTTLTLWLPTLIEEKSTVKKPLILAKSALVYDLTTGKTLFSQNPKEQLPMASITKIMTAIIALEHKKTNDTYAVSKNDLVGEDSMGLSVGEKLSLEELLYGLMLSSGNDAAEVLASNYSGGREAFIKAMNDKAKTLGLTDTHFTNPTGLEGDGNQHTTAYDLLVITHFGLENFSLFRSVSQTYAYTIPNTPTHKSFYLENETNLLTSYPGVKGVKTGFTPEAQLCLVTYLEYDGHRLVGILLGSNNRRLEMKELLDYSLKSLGVTPPPHW